jgi:hypothetical protein
MSDEFQGAGAGIEGGGDQGAGGASPAPQSHSGASESGSHSAGAHGTDSAPDWRSTYLEGLDDGLKDRASKYLERRKGHNDVLRSALEADGKISELSESLKGRIKLPTGQNDDPADIAAFRKALGVPEAADAYQVWEPEGSKWDDVQRAGIAEFLSDAHAANLSQKQVDVALQALSRANALGVQQWQHGAQEAARQTKDALRKEYGREFTANVVLANREMMKIFGDDSEAVANIRLSDGRYLGDHLGFVKGMVALAKQNSDAGVLDIGDGRPSPSRDGRLDELYALQTSDYKKYKSKAVQDEILQLETAKQNQGRGRR